MKPIVSLVRVVVLLSICAGAMLTGATVGAVHFRMVDRVALAGNGGWDYASADSDARRLYVTHDTVVHVLDLDTLKVVGTLAPVGKAHGVALAPVLGRGFISDGNSNTVQVFDLKTLAFTTSWPSRGKNPDAILYDAFSGRVFAFNGGSNVVTAFDAMSGAVAGTLALGGKPEFAVCDGAGAAFVNIEDTNETVRFDARTLAITARWPLAPGTTPTALGLDVSGRRLFAGCRSGHLVVLDSDTGARVADLPIGAGVDAITYDPKGGRIFVSNGDGTLTVVRQLSAQHYEVVATVKTPLGSRTHAWDAKTGRLFLPGAQMLPVPASDDGRKPAWVFGVPDSFRVVVLGP